jgi:hypothetical protein
MVKLVTSLIVIFWVSFTLKMEAASSSETFVTISNTTKYQNKENHNPNLHCLENLKAKLIISFARF